MNEWLLLLIFTGVALAACCIGFKKFVWFLSIGYGYAVAALGVAYAIYGTFTDNLDLIGLFQGILFVLYGARLSGFLLQREIKNASYRKVLASATKSEEKKVPFFVLFTIWIMVGPLYVAQTAPMFYRLFNQGCTARLGSELNLTNIILPVIGLVISFVGLLIETLADIQKSAEKKVNPKMVATHKLYKMVRCPNYLGEITFWTGVFVGGILVYNAWWQWVVAALGYVCIVYIMINGAQRLDRRQEKNYGENPEYRAYADHTPLIFPLLPIYHIGYYKVADQEAAAARKAAKKAARAAKKNKGE